MISIGNIHINPKSFKGTDKQSFLNLFKGKSDADLNVVWDLVQKHNEVSEVIDLPLEKPKRKKKKNLFTED